MKFTYYSPQLLYEPKISVDGLVPNSFHLSHWAGNHTPAEFKADTSTEIALNFVTHPSHHEIIRTYPMITNNHFDTDGLLAIWTLLAPSQALPHKEFLIKAAEAGDFNQYTTPSAVQFNLMITAFRESPASPFAEAMEGLSHEQKDSLCYQSLIERLASLISNPKPYRGLWEAEFQNIEASFEQFEKGEIMQREFAQEKLSVVLCEKRPSRYAINHYCQGDLFLIVQTQADGFHYDLEYRYYSWADTVTRPQIPRVPMGALASRLNIYDGRGIGRWMTEGFEGQPLTMVLKYTNGEGESLPSRFPYENVTRFIRDYIQENKPKKNDKEGSARIDE